MMMLACIKQHLSNTWSSIYEKVKQLWGWVEKHFKRQKFEAKKHQNHNQHMTMYPCTYFESVLRIWYWETKFVKKLARKKNEKINVKILHVVPLADLPRQYIFMVCTKFVIFSSNWNSSKHFSFCLEAFKRYSWKTKSDNW